MTIRFFGELFSPLRMAFDDRGRAQGLLADLGCNVTLTETQYTSLRNIATLSDTLDQLADLADRAADADGTASAAEIAEIAAASIQMIESAWSAVQSLGSLDTADLLALPSPLDQSTTWAELAQALPDYLLVRWLRLQMPPLYAAAVAAGVVVDRSDATGATVGTTTVDLGAIGALVADPAAHLISSYGWGAGLDHRRLLDGVERFTRSLGLRTVRGPIEAQFAAKYYGDALSTGVEQITVTLVTPRPDNGFASSVVHLLAVPPAPDGEAPSGFAIEHRGFGIVETSVSIADDWTLAVSATADADGPGMRLDPSGVHPVGLATPTLLSVTIVGEPVSPWRPVGTASGPRLEISRLAGTFELGSDAAGQTAALELSTEQGGHPSLVATLAGEDGFLASLLGGPFSVEIPLTIRWSTDEGWTIDGALGTQVVIPLSLSIGPIELLELVVGIAASLDGVGATIAVSVAGQLGPVSATVDGLGLSLALAAGADDGASGLRAELGIKPPDGVGIGLDLGVVSGGGYLDIDAEAGSYEGVLDLELLGVGISAIAIIDTRLPDVDGWSMFFALFLDLPSIQLGFGFTLTGVGGVAGINRAIDADALGSAVRSGSLDTILFPENPIADAPIIIEEFRSIFPPADGSYVFGPIVKLGWGTPTLIEAELGIVIQLPDPVVIVVLGSISAILPTKDTALVALNLDVAGVIDFEAGTLAIDASLHDSHVVGFALSGDMALRAEFGNAQAFLMSVGGFHPRFDPPGDFPELRPVTFGISAGSILRIDFQSYFALTSNSVQCGARFTLDADVMGFGVYGSSGFDALIQFSPFMVITSVDFEVSITAAGVDLMGVMLYASVEGPNRWHVIGTARFEVLGFGKDIRVDELIGAKDTEPPVEAADLLDELITALASDDAWHVVEASDPAVTLSDIDDPAAPLLATPDSLIEVRQALVPLGLEIEQFGNAPVGEYASFDLAAVGLPAVASLDDWFAPGQFFELSGDEKLEGPEFELMRAGIRFGGDEPAVGPHVAVDTGYRSYILDPELPEADTEIRYTTVVRSTAGVPITAHTSGGFTTVHTDTVATAPTTYVLVDDHGTITAQSTTWASAHAARGDRIDLHIERDLTGARS